MGNAAGEVLPRKADGQLQVLKEDALPSYGVRPALLASVEERMAMKSFGDHCFCAHTRTAFVLEASDCLVLVVWGQV